MKYTIVRNGKDRPRYTKMSHQLRAMMKRRNWERNGAKIGKDITR